MKGGHKFLPFSWLHKNVNVIFNISSSHDCSARVHRGINHLYCEQEDIRFNRGSNSVVIHRFESKWNGKISIQIISMDVNVALIIVQWHTETNKYQHSETDRQIICTYIHFDFRQNDSYFHHGRWPLSNWPFNLVCTVSLELLIIQHFTGLIPHANDLHWVSTGF